MIRNLGLQGKHKLADSWKSTPYIIESQLPGLPVFRLRLEEGNGPEKVLHRNHILPISQEVRLEPEKSTEKSKSKLRVSKRLKAKRIKNCSPSTSPASEEGSRLDTATDSEEEDMGSCYSYDILWPSYEQGNKDTERAQPFSLDLYVSGPEVISSPGAERGISEKTTLTSEFPVCNLTA